MTFIESVSHCTENFLNFSGRASRSEYWWFQLFLAMFLFCIVGFLPKETISNMSDKSLLLITVLFRLLNMSVTVRRLHDLSLSGMRYVIFFIPYVGVFIEVLLMLRKGAEATNEYGNPPN